MRPGRLALRLAGLFGSPLEIRHRVRAEEERFFRWVLLAVVLGMGTGLAVAAFDFVLREQAVIALYQVHRALLFFALPIVGLLAAALAVRFLVPSRESALTEAYIIAFHDVSRPLRLRDVPGKMLASFATVACGGSMGLEGPSLYLGAALGDSAQRRFVRLFRREDAKLLMVAGAAAGMAAIFKAPLTGVVFALEAPYLIGLVGRALVPSLVAACSSYITFVFLAGSEPIFISAAISHADLLEIALALVLGLVCGLGARVFVMATKGATRLLHRLPIVPRALLAGVAVGAVGTGIFEVFHHPYIYGPGYMLIRHLLEEPEPVSLLLLLFAAKVGATALTTGGGGVGGLFFPMAVMGTILGSAFGHLAPETPNAFYPLIGLAAFIAGGYRTPLAAAVFVAETTGSPWTLIPATLASVMAFLVSGPKGISDEQR